MNYIKFKCGGCFERVEVPASRVGETVTCSHCNQRIIVPEIPQQAEVEEIKQVKPKKKFNLEMMVFNLLCFIGALFSVFMFLMGIAKGGEDNSILGFIVAILSAMLFFIVVASNKIVTYLKFITDNR
ncbi:MAG: hypothetical protein NE327_10600 [Lentisphaeraceae bacterium]|nr:hypothetical protein [Lentisphaeraceae bacterium]